MGFLDLLSAADVILDVSPSNKGSLLELLATEAAKRIGRSSEDVLDALKAREKIGSTGLGKGIALPHAEIQDAPSPVVLFARLTRPVGFDAEDDQPVDLVFLVLWPAVNRKGLLTVMSEICRVLREPQWLRRLRSAPTPEDVIQTLREAATTADQGVGPDEG